VTKKPIYLAFSLLLLSSLCFGTTGKKYKFSFTVKELAGKTCKLGVYYGDKEYIQDSAVADKDGNFDFSGDSVPPGGVYFVLTPTHKNFDFVIDKDLKFSMTTDTSDFVKNMKVKGSDENAMFYAYLNFITLMHNKITKAQEEEKTASNKDIYKKRIDSVDNAVKTYQDNITKKHPDMLIFKVLKAGDEPEVPDSIIERNKKEPGYAYHYYKAHFFDNVDFNDGRLVRSPVFFLRLKEYVSKLTAPTSDSVIAAANYLVNKGKNDKDMYKFIVSYFTSTYEVSDIMGMDAVFVHMVRTYYTPDKATWVSASLLERMKERANQLAPTLLGNKAPNMVMPDTNDHETDLSTLNAKYTLVYFWDFDCGLCQKETPGVVAWFDSVKAQGIMVYAVQTNNTTPGWKAKWKDYIKVHHLDWINVSDTYSQSDYHKIYDVEATPVIYLLDANKNIIAKKISPSDLNKVLKHAK
jgi:peroxiredoxin